MSSTDIFIVVLLKLAVGGILFCLAGILPWVIAARLHDSLPARHRTKWQVQSVALLSVMLWLLLTLQPQHLTRCLPPAADFIAQSIADTPAEPPAPRLILQTLLMGETVVLFVFPVLLCVFLLLAALYAVAFAPGLRVLCWAFSQPIVFVRGRRHAARCRRDQQRAFAAATRAERQRLLAEQRHQQAAERQRHVQEERAADELRSALKLLSAAPDFRRCCLAAESARGCLSTEERRKLFAMSRPTLVNHLATRLEAKHDAAELMQSLRGLLRHLGVPGHPHESEYILVDAEKLLPSETVVVENEYRTSIQQMHEAHRTRMKVLEGFEDEDLRSRLTEAEVERFQDEILDFTKPREDVLPALGDPFVPPSLQDGHSDVVPATDES